MINKFIPTALLAITAFILIGGNVAMAATAVHKQVQTIDNAKKIIIKAGADTFVVNVNSVKGEPGSAGKNGTNGANGAPGANGTQGIQGVAGANGTSTVIVCTTNSTNPLCGNTPTPVPVPTPVNGTGNHTATHAHK
jgi:Collagen triple helix repeat (20 copies)